MHPYLWEDRDIDWDAALTGAIPKVSNARTDDDEAAAVQSMLNELHDPLTRVEASDPQASEAPLVKTSGKWATADVLVLKLALHDFGEMRDLEDELRKEIEKAKALVIDLRASDARPAFQRDCPPRLHGACFASSSSLGLPAAAR
jgi:hypothetical protein